ncbi:MAG: HAMP domain-containing histidine kinase [Rhizobiales bacterium]|nr:HAMP domain-containing histidine kinase [Hyphomicrobiales bacterium]
MPRLLRTAVFRLSAGFAAVTAFTLVVLFAVSYWIVTQALTRQISAGVEGQFSSALSDPVLSSSLPDNDDDHRLMALGRTLADGSFLLIGDDLIRVLAAQETITIAFEWASLVSILPAILLGVVVSRGVLRRIDKINEISRAIADGHLKERIPVRGTADEFDRLAVNLNAMLDSNQALQESLKNFSANVAHELRAPLSRLHQRLDGLRGRLSEPNAATELLDAAAADSERLIATFGALLRIAQIESGTRRSAFRAVSLHDVLRRIAEIYLPVAEDEGKSLTTDIAAEAMCFGDVELLTQMFANLIENAIKHTPPGAAVKISLRLAGPLAVAEIEDNGNGIPPSELDNVLEPFYRLEFSRTTSGSGLGLALVKSVAALHDARLIVENASPGLRCRLEFPLLPAA